MKTDKLPHYRQGDVLLQRVASLPKKGLKKVPRQAGRIIVALGSSNGNPHYFDDPKSVMFTSETGEQSLELAGQKITGTLPATARTANSVLTDHPKLGLIKFHLVDGKLSADGKTFKVSGVFALMKHNEHYAHGLPAGPYSHIRQSGFNRGEIRRVQD